MKLKDLTNNIYLKLNPTYKKTCEISNKLDALTEPHYPSGIDKVEIEPGHYSTKWFVYDYENLKDTVVKDSTLLYIDIGANEGQSAKYAYKFFGENTNVISYEPLKSCIPFLDNVKNNHPNYIYKNLAMADKKGTVTFNEIGGRGLGVTGLSSMLEIKDDYTYFNPDTKNIITDKYEIESTTIQDEIEFWESFKCEKKILKIDTQGTELSILKQGEEYFKNGNIDVILIEIMVRDKYKNQCHYLDTISFLDSCGFRIYDIRAVYREKDGKFVGADGWNTGWSTEYDFTFVHKNILGIE